MANSFIEICDSKMIDKLSSMSFSVFIDIIKKSEWRKDLEDETLASNYEDQYRIIKNVCNDYKNNNYKLLVNYKPYASNPEGRVYADKGIQNIWGLFKGLIAYDKYYDFDMSCAHHSLLKYLCVKHDIDCEELTYYVQNRERCLREFQHSDCIDRREAKDMYIASLNCEYKKNKLSDHKTKIKYQKFIDFDNEIKTIQKKLTKFYKNQWNTIKRKNHDGDNRYGKFISHLCFQIENKILQKVIKDIRPNVLMFDGFMIDKTKIPNTEEFVEKLNNQTKGIVKWAEKEMDYSMYDYVSEIDIVDCVSIISPDCCALAKELINGVFSNKIYSSDSGMYFNDGHQWIKGMGGTTTKDKVYQSLSCMIATEFDLWLQDKETKKLTEIKKTTKTIDELIKFIYIQAPKNNDFINDVWDNSLLKLYFNNGYWDFKKQKLCEHDGNTFINIERDLDLKSDPNIRSEIFRRILDPIFTCYENYDDYEERCQLRDCWLYFMSRALAGHVEDKRWVYQTGERDCGKGVLCDLIQHCVGQYAKTTSAKQFALKDIQSGDAAKELSFLAPCQFNRFLFTSEIEVNGKKKVVFDGNKVKMVASGGDYIQTRTNYVDEYLIRVQFLLSMFFNQENECCPTDALQKNVCFTFKTKFIDDKFTGIKYNNIHYMKKDDSVKMEFIKDKKVQNEFLLLLLDSYNKPTDFPTALQEERDEDIETDESKLCNFFEITDNAADKILLKDLQNIINEIGCNLNKTKAKKYLTGIGAKEGRDMNARFLQGIKIRPQNVNF